MLFDVSVIDTALSTPPSWLAYVNSGGVLGLMGMITWAFFKRKVRTEGELNDTSKLWSDRFEDMKTQRDEWKTSMIKQLDVNTSQAAQITRLTDILEVLTQKGGSV